MANDDPPVVLEHSTNSDSDSDPTCPFCTITETFQPISPKDTTNSLWNPDRLSPPTYVLLSTPHVVAFLDIAPLTRGHVLIAPRQHRVKISDLSSNQAAEIGRIMPIVARAVMKSVLPDLPDGEVDYNLVQNNGPGAAQVIPHVHFHVIPRPPLDYKQPTGNSSSGRKVKYARSEIPTGLKASYIQFGRGQRHELDDDDAVELVQVMRENLLKEWEKEFGSSGEVARSREQKL